MAENGIPSIKETIVSRESHDPIFLSQLYARVPYFAQYQCSASTLKQSVYNNVYLLSRHYERFKLLSRVIRPARSLLEVGCGFGDLSLEFANSGKDQVMLDIDTERLLVAKLRSQKLGLTCDIVRGDAHQLPFRAEAFDVSFSNQMIEHVEDPARILKEKLRVSRRSAIVMSAAIAPSLAFRIGYYNFLKRTTPEQMPDLEGYDDIYWLNPIMIPLNNRISIHLARLLTALPYLNRVLATAVVKVFHKAKYPVADPLRTDGR